tara:strand:+ start:793 stop:2361 length:1569 start_codon:yes stop_codon:yes gene_type:complete
MKISSGAKISKSTLKRSVKAIKEQDVLRSFSKDSSDRGIYVSLSYAPGSGQNTISPNIYFYEPLYPQIIYVTINNIPRYRDNLELLSVSNQGQWLPYFRMEGGGKIYQPSYNNLNGISGSSTSTTFSMASQGLNWPNILRPAIGVDKNSGLPSGNAWFSGTNQSSGVLWHPKMVSQDPSAAMLGESPYMTSGHANYVNTPGLMDNANKAWQWIANERYVNVTFPIYIRQSLLPDNGKFGLTRIRFRLSYNQEILHENLPWYGTAQLIEKDNNEYDLNNLILLEGRDPGLVGDGIVYGGYTSKREADEGTIILSSVNELPTYGVSNNTSTLLGVRPANFMFHPTTGMTGFAQLIGSNFNVPQLILSEDGEYVKKITMGKWFSIDKNYGKSIGYKCTYEIYFTDGSTGVSEWQENLTQNDLFTKSNIKLEDLSPSIDFDGNFLDLDYLKYGFSSSEIGFKIKGVLTSGSWNGVRAKITARLVQDGQIYESSMYSTPVYAQAASSALSYYYYGGEGFEGVGVNNL